MSAHHYDGVDHIYSSGKTNSVAFSHGGPIMIWVLTNVRNPDESLLTTKQLPNLGPVVVTGDPTDGWTLQE